MRRRPTSFRSAPQSHGLMDSRLDEMLVSYVEQHPCLYDRKHVHYKHRDKTAKVWLAVADRLETTVEVVEARWRFLKKAFAKALGQTTPQAAKCKRSSKQNCIAFPLFKSMLWLAPYMKNSDRATTMKKQIKCPVHGTLDSTTAKTLKSQKLEESAIVESDGNATDLQNSSFSSESSFFQKSCASITGRKYMKIKAERDDKCTQTDNTKEPQKKKHSKPFSPQCPSSLNADVNFMLSVVSDMQMISPKKKIRFKREVFELLEKNIFEEKN